MALPPLGRSPHLLLGVALVILGGIAAASTVQLSRLKGLLVEKQQAVQSLTAQNDELAQQLDALAVQRKELETRLTDLRNQLASATGDVARLRLSVEELQTRYKALEAENATLQVQVSRLTKERDEARTTILKAEEDKKELERAAGRLRERLVFLERDYQQLAAKVSQLEQSRVTPLPAVPSSPSADSVEVADSAAEPPAPAPPATGAPASSASPTVELPPIVVRKDQGTSGLPIRAQVVEVNEPYRFVVVDKGANDGVPVGLIFDVLRGGAKIAQVVAVRVRPQLAACDVLTSQSPAFPRIGDVAIQRNP